MRSLKQFKFIPNLQKKNLPYLTLILAVIILIYWPVYYSSFLIGWDDQWFVTNHYTEGGFATDNVFSILSEYYYGQYAPVNQFYYTALYHFFKYNTGIFHISSIAIHGLNCLLLYYFLRGFLTDIGSGEYSKNVKLAFFTTLLFAILPVNVEPVSWIAASKVLLYAFFYLLTLISYRNYLRSRKPFWFYLCILLFLLSLGAKEQAVVLPLCLLLMDYLCQRDLSRSDVWLEKLPFIILSVLVGLATIDSQKLDGDNFYSITERIPLFFYSVSEYFTKCVFPVNLSYLYPFPFEKGEAIPAWMWIHVFSIPIICICFFRFLKNKVLLFSAGFFLIHIVLTSNIVSLARFAVVADRYTYVAAIGCCLMVSQLFLKYASGNFKFVGSVKILGMLYLLFLIWTAQGYVPVWKNAFTLKKRLKLTIESRADFKSRTDFKKR